MHAILQCDKCYINEKYNWEWGRSFNFVGHQKRPLGESEVALKRSLRTLMQKLLCVSELQVSGRARMKVCLRNNLLPSNLKLNLFGGKTLQSRNNLI
jgi:hypothetical protein